MKLLNQHFYFTRDLVISWSARNTNGSRRCDNLCL